MKERWKLRLFEANRRVAEAELVTSALTQTVLVVMKTEGDPNEALERLWQHMDELEALRGERARLERLRQRTVRAALRSQPTEKGT